MFNLDVEPHYTHRRNYSDRCFLTWCPSSVVEHRVLVFIRQVVGIPPRRTNRDEASEEMPL